MNIPDPHALVDARPANSREALILAIDEQTLGIGGALLRMLDEGAVTLNGTPDSPRAPGTSGVPGGVGVSDAPAAGAPAAPAPLAMKRHDWPLMLVRGSGEALRAIWQLQPRGLFVCVGLERLDDATALIDAVRRRRRGLPQVALAGEHDERLERAVRVAGASYYFPLAGHVDPGLIRSAIEAIGIGLHGPPRRVGPLPPARTPEAGHDVRPLARARGRPPSLL